MTDPKVLFAQLSLCTQQCGVSWKIVWNKRHHYEAAFHNWDLASAAAVYAAKTAWLRVLSQRCSCAGHEAHFLQRAPARAP